MGFSTKGVTGMITISNCTWGAWNVNGLVVGGVEVNSKFIKTFKCSSGIHDWSVRMGGKETEDTIKTGECCFSGTMGELR